MVRGSESETEAPSFDWFDNLFEQIPKDTINVTETKKADPAPLSALLMPNPGGLE